MRWRSDAVCKETFVLKVEIEQRVARHASLLTLGQTLPKEGGLATTPHADNGNRLALDARQMDITVGMRRHRGGERIRYLLADDLLKFSFHKRQLNAITSFLKGYIVLT
jgi:hypothetical protein